MGGMWSAAADLDTCCRSSLRQVQGSGQALMEGEGPAMQRARPGMCFVLMPCPSPLDQVLPGEACALC